MTAIIGILNKTAVAIAADSAVSVGSGNARKVYNSANKMFNLTIGAPIGIMIYNNAEFCDIPWETVIKMYRGHSQGTKFDAVVGYRDDFMKYLTTFQKYYTDEKLTVTEILRNVFSGLDESLGRLLKATYSEEETEKFTDEEKNSIIESHLVDQLNKDLERLRSMEFLPGFDEGDKANLSTTFAKEIEEHIQAFVSGLNLKEEDKIRDLLKQLFLEWATRRYLVEAWTGVVFTGFGELEIFPALYSVKIGKVLNGKIRHYLEPDVVITVESDATITPFAQIDIMQTFVEGIDPFVKSQLPLAFEAALEQFKEHVLSQIDYSTDNEKKLKAVLDSAIPDTVKSLVDRLEDLRYDNHIGPMLNTISSLSKEDLTEMAESLINLTYLKRRASFSEESVGGPIDVAVITKGDGFVWIKRKHYFNPALNLNYIAKINQKQTN